MAEDGEVNGEVNGSRHRALVRAASLVEAASLESPAAAHHTMDGLSLHGRLDGPFIPKVAHHLARAASLVVRPEN